MEGFNGRVKNLLDYRRLTWQGLENAGIHVRRVWKTFSEEAVRASRVA